MTQFTVQAQITRKIDDDLESTTQVPTFIIDSAIHGTKTIQAACNVALEVLGVDYLPPGSEWHITIQNLETKYVASFVSSTSVL